MNKKAEVQFAPLDPVRTGAKGRCPRCGEGALFEGLLTVKDKCNACDLDYAFNDAGDGPTVFVIMGLGFVILGAALFLELNYQPPTWLHIVLWPPMILALGLPVLRMTKGILIALTWHNNASQGVLAKSENREDTAK